MANAVHMARLAVAAGTDTMVATPHEASFGRSSAPPHWLRGLVKELQFVLGQKQVPLTVVPGVEIKIGPRVAEGLAARTLMTLGDARRWALLEPAFDRIPPESLAQVQAVRDAGFGVVLAHPERSREVQQSLAFVEACADMGCAFQLTTGSLLGHFGGAAQRTAEAILARAHEWPLVLASDTHDLVDRSPSFMPQAEARAAEIVGPAEARRMTDERPRAMLFPAR